MSIPGSAEPLLLAQQDTGGYQIQRSLRFNSSDSAFCSRTFSSTGNRTSWTWSGWVKRSGLSSSSRQVLFGGYGANNDTDWFEFGFGHNSSVEPSDTIYWTQSSVSSYTAAVYRDTSAWYHIVATYDGSNLRFYVNNALVLTSAKTGNLGVNGAWLHTLGRSPNSGIRYFDGYLADVYFIDGQTLTPSSFVETSATTGQLIPKQYTGSFGTNGFWLKFSDNSAATATTLGKDYSGNNNNWTPNNLSVTAGAGNDSLTDTPSSYGTDTGAGGEVRGNYATWNPLANGAGSLSNGNLDLANSGPDTRCNSTISVSSGKWYYEIRLNTLGTNSSAGIGQKQITNAWPGNDAVSYAYELDNARTAQNGNLVAYGSALAAGDIFMCAFDLDNNKIFFGKNGTWFNSSNPATGTNPAFTLAAGSYCPIGRPYGGGSFSLNTGARPFAYTAPSGFKALCDTNLPTPVVAKSSDYFQTVLYTGNGSTQTISGLNFSPDLVWGKGRSYAGSNALYDSVRGATKYLTSNGTGAEGTVQGVTAFNSDGFTLGNDSETNFNAGSLVAWCWDAGTSTVTNTQGSITTSVRASASSGFAVITGSTPSSNVNFSFGHNLGIAPSLVIYKHTAVGGNWQVYHRNGGGNNYNLNSTAGPANSGLWSGLDPTSTLITIPSTIISANSSAFVCYAWAPVTGYSSAFTYTGNGSSDGPMVWLGFRPRLILAKQSSASGTNWYLIDSARGAYNVVDKLLNPNTSDSEETYSQVDFLSNGFKIRNTGTGMNANGATMIGFAWAESPFAYSRAR